MTETMLPRVLCVDDEEKLLRSIQRSLRKVCVIHTATSGEAGLDLIRREGPFEVVISDMRMPGMDGATFLSHVREEAPETVRLLLTGVAELETVIAAVNEGYIYRFLAKPCAAPVIYDAILDAVEQHRLVTAQRELLEKTLKGSVQALTEVLALAAPAAFGRATRIRDLAVMLAYELGYDALWQVEVAALFSQLACVTLPPQTALRLYRGEPLTEPEQDMVARLPGVTTQILGDIPRLEPVHRILAQRDLDFTPPAGGAGPVRGHDISPGARILRVATDVEELQARGEGGVRCTDLLRARRGRYDPAVIAAFERLSAEGELDFQVRAVSLDELRTGMQLAADVSLEAGTILVAAGQEITVSLLERLRNFRRSQPVKEPVLVRVPEPAAPAPGGSDLIESLR